MAADGPTRDPDALDAYVREHNTTTSAVIRDAVEAYLATTGPVG